MKKTFFYIYLALLSLLVSDPYGSIAEHLVESDTTEELALKKTGSEESSQLELEEEQEESLSARKSFVVQQRKKAPTQTLYHYDKTTKNPFVLSAHKCLRVLHESFLC